MRFLANETFSRSQKSHKRVFTYEVRFLGKQVGQAASDFTKQAYVVKHLMRVGQKCPKNI